MVYHFDIEEVLFEDNSLLFSPTFLLPFKDILRQIVSDEFWDSFQLNRMWNRQQIYPILITQILLQLISLNLVKELLFSLLGVIGPFIMLNTVVLSRQFQFIIVTIQFQCFARQRIQHKIGPAGYERNLIDIF